MKRNKVWKAFTGASNTNDLGHVSGVMENDFHAIKAGSNVLVSALPNKNIITIEELNAPQGQFYWTSAIQGVSLSLMDGLVIQTQNSVIRIRAKSFLEAINFRKILLAKMEEFSRPA